MKKIISTLCIMCILMSMVLVMNVSFAATKNTYQKYKDFVNDGYGITDKVDGSTILKVWNWSYANTTARMKQIAEQGFSAIEVSPAYEIKNATKDVSFAEGTWWFYEPVGFQLNQSADNALGTKSEFVAMCAEAKKYGIKVIVEAEVGHIAGVEDISTQDYDTSPNPMDHVSSKVAQFEPELVAAQAFHAPWIRCNYVENANQNAMRYDSAGNPITDSFGNIVYHNATDKDIEESITQHSTTTGADLATENWVVQEMIYDYLEELIQAGASGFNFFKAKHIETPSDSYYGSDFWEDTLEKVREAYPQVECYSYGEILNKAGDGRPLTEYTRYMDVTNSSYLWYAKDCVVHSSANLTLNTANDGVVLFTENFDMFSDGSTSNLTSMQRNKIWALSAAREGVTGVYFARPTETPFNHRDKFDYVCSDILLGEANETAWSYPEVAAVNRFKAFFGDVKEYIAFGTRENATSVVDSAVISRVGNGLAGAVVVKTKTDTDSITVKNTELPDGDYYDALTNNEFRVRSGVLTGTVGPTGIACIYYDEYLAPEVEYPNDQENLEFPWNIEISDGVYPVVEGYNTIVLRSNWNYANFYAWKSAGGELKAWPGDQMLRVGKGLYGENIFIAYIPKAYNRYIINDGNTVQTVDLNVDESHGIELLSVDAEGKYKGTKWQPDFYMYGSKEPDAQGEYTVYFTAGTDWPDAYVYGFYGEEGISAEAESHGKYPGQKMTFVGYNEYGNKIYSCKVPADVDFIMFTDGSSANRRTVNIPNIKLGNNVGFCLGDSKGDNKWDVVVYAYDSNDVIPSELSSSQTTAPETEPTTTAEPTEPTETTVVTEPTETTVVTEPTEAPTTTAPATETTQTEPMVPVITYLVGDANMDGKINVKDATQIQKAVAGLVTLNVMQTIAADSDVNGKLNVKDATAIQKFVAGISVDAPVGEEKEK